MRSRPLRSRRRRALAGLLAVVAAAAWGVDGFPGVAALGGGLADLGRPLGIHEGRPISPLRARIVSIAESQLGYASDPPDSYCNRYSAYWQSGQDDCAAGLLDEEWCADFAAWVWRKAGAVVDYQFVNGDLNSSSASFYEWGVAHGTWHPVGSGYTPQPGDAVVYGLDVSTLVAQHVAIVTSMPPRQRGPDVVNGDGDRTGFSVVETGTDQYDADVPGAVAPLSGYVSPTAPGAGGPGTPET